MTDPIADMITRIRNAVHARHQRVEIPASRFKTEIARILEQEGYIQSFKLIEAGGEVARPVIRIFLKYGPLGERVYLDRSSVPTVMGGLGTSILTTSRGVMTGREAVKAGVGGEVLCNVW